MKKFFEKPERLLSMEEIDDRMQKMTQERARQDAEARNKFHIPTNSTPHAIIEKPLSMEEINDRMRKMIQERARQDVEAHARHQNDNNLGRRGQG
jgi:uncharacterized small protein (DUF1192 family)